MLVSLDAEFQAIASVSDVVGHQRGQQAEGMGGDQRVEGALAPEGGFIKGQDRQRCQKQLECLPVPRGATLSNAVGQFSSHHAADPDLPHAVVPEALQSCRRLGIDDVVADDGVKQDQGVSSSRSRCRCLDLRGVFR